VQGRIVDSVSGAPVTQARLDVRGEAAAPLASLITGDDGRFDVSVPAEPASSLTIDFLGGGAKDNYLQASWTREVDPKSPPVTDFGDLPAEMGGVVKGTIVAHFDDADVDSFRQELAFLSVPGLHPGGAISVELRSGVPQPWRAVVAAGDWLLELPRAPAGLFPRFLWPDNSDGSAGLITTVAGETVTGIDVELRQSNVISGRISNAAGQPLESVYIWIYRVGGSAYPIETRTDMDGRFLQRLPDGDYRVRATTFGDYFAKLGDLAPRYYGNTDGSNHPGSVISLSGNAYRDDIDITLLRLSSVSGTAHVSAISPGNYGIRAVNVETGDIYRHIYASEGPPSSGEYTILHLPPGRFRIEFFGDYGSFFYGNTSNPDKARIVTVPPGPAQDLTGLDAQLTPEMMPRVTGAAVGQDGARIGWINCDTGELANPELFNHESVENGRIDVMVPLYRKIQIVTGPPESLTRYGECVTLDVNETYEIPGATLSGTVHVPAGPERTFTVDAVDPTGNSSTVASGRIPAGRTSMRWETSADALSPGEYFVRTRIADFGTAYALSDNPMVRPEQPVRVATGDAVTGLDVTYKPGARFSGTVVTNTFCEVDDGQVRLFSEAEPSVPAATATLRRSGEFDVWGLPPGAYTARFDPIDSCGAVLATQWFQRSPDQQGAERITLAAGEALTDVIVRLNGTNAITGRITDAAGNPLEGAYVRAEIYNVPPTPQETRTGPDGVYTLSGLPDGIYAVRASTFEGSGDIDDLAPRYYGDTDGSNGTRTALTLRQGQALGGIDITLLRLSSVSGTATLAHSSWWEGYSVRASDVDTGHEFSATDGVTSAGEYTIPYLPPGRYRILFVGKFGAIYYGSTSRHNRALIVTIPPGPVQHLTGLDVRLPPPPRIEGVIRGHEGEAVGWKECSQPEGIYTGERVEGSRFSIAVPMNLGVELVTKHGDVTTSHGQCVTLFAGEHYRLSGITLSGTITVPPGDSRAYTVSAVDAAGETRKLARGEIAKGATTADWMVRPDFMELKDLRVLVQVKQLGSAWAFSGNPQLRPEPINPDLSWTEVEADVSFTAGARMSGRVTTDIDVYVRPGGGSDVLDGQVYVYEDAAPAVLVATSTIRRGGAFDVWGLPPGTYTARFEARHKSGVPLEPQWYVASVNQGGATRIALATMNSATEYLRIAMRVGPLPGEVAPPPTGEPEQPAPPAVLGPSANPNPSPNPRPGAHAVAHLPLLGLASTRNGTSDSPAGAPRRHRPG
jgi:Carboxypeptidase regulatory-like domain